MRHGLLALAAALAVSAPLLAGAEAPGAPGVFDIRSYGARPDDQGLDTAAINRAIEAASAKGGVVHLPPGRWLSFSIRLRSRVTLQFAPGAVLEAADPARHGGRYDLPEANPHDVYQDFGHSHWRNSLLWGEDVHDVAIVGPGLIDGAGLTREGPGARWSRNKVGDRPLSMGPADRTSADRYEAEVRAMNGLGNKAIALKNARNVTFRDFSVLRGGHFAFLLTGVDNLVMESLRIDTNRDGVDLDVVRNARLSNLTVNTPNDDAIVLKSSLALGAARPTENVTITNCQVSGYDLGTMLDGTFRKTQELSPDQDRVTGRIKLGTESNGGFRNIAISNCVFDRSRGLALESVDGGVLEDVTISNIVMRDVTTAPIFLRLGDRRRAPEGTGMASLRRVTISNVTAYGIDPRYAAIIAGLPGRPVEDVTLSNIRLVFQGGGTQAHAVRTIPEQAEAYPEPSMFGVTPAYGLYARHARNLVLRDIQLSTERPDARPPVVLDDVTNIRADGVTAAQAGAAPSPVALPRP
jgi:polygalacturonase